jgi:hypothetical protein
LNFASELAMNQGPTFPSLHKLDKTLETASIEQRHLVRDWPGGQIWGYPTIVLSPRSM